MNKKLTESDEQILLTQYKDKTLAELASMIGCAVSTVRNHLKRSGAYKSCAWTDNDDRLLIELVAQEVRTEEIARELQRTKTAINQRIIILRHQGVDIPKRKKLFKPIEDEKRRARSQRESARYAALPPEKKKELSRRNVELKRLRRYKQYGLQTS